MQVGVVGEGVGNPGINRTDVVAGSLQPVHHGFYHRSVLNLTARLKKHPAIVRFLIWFKLVHDGPPTPDH